MEVTKTNDEALIARASLHTLGIIEDPHVACFRLPRNSICPPLMCRGTFIRTKAIDNATESLVNSVGGDQVQVLSLGAGFDTRWHRHFYKSRRITAFVEADLPIVAEKKVKALENCAPARDDRYRMAKADVRNTTQSLRIPTIVLAECLFMYLSPSAVSGLVSLLESYFNHLYLIQFDPIFIKGSAFSEKMIDNFEARGILLQPTWHISPSEAIAGFDWSSREYRLEYGATMRELESSSYLTEQDKLILKGRLALDEYEEWDIISNHYALRIMSFINTN